jgi:PAS domain S-box-containing protein
MARSFSTRSPWARFGVAAGATLLAALLRWILVPVVGQEQPLVLFVFAVIVAAWWGGLWAGIVATALSVVLGTWMFIAPLSSFSIDSAADRARVVLFTLVGVGISVACESILGVVRRSREQELALHRSNLRLNLLAESVGVLLRSESPRTAVNEICQKVMAFLDCQCFFNYLLDEKVGRLRLNAFAGVAGKEARRVECLDVGESACGMVARTGQPIVVTGIQELQDPETALLREWGLKAYASHPLVVGNRLLGTIAFGTRTRSQFTEEETALIKTVSDHIAIAIHRKLTGEALLGSEERYRAFVGTSLEAIWRMELEEPLDTAKTVDEQVAHLFKHAYYAEANDAMARLYGYERGEQVVGMRMSDVESAAHGPTVESIRKFITEGYRRSGEESHEKDRFGETRNFLNNYVGIVKEGFLVRVWGSSLDVTERRKAEDALMERTALLQAVSENVTDLIFAKDRDGRMMFANPATLEVVRRSKDEVIGRTDLEWTMNSEQSKRMIENDRQVLAQGITQKFEEDFGDRIFEAVKTPLRDAVGNIIGVVGVARDVTEFKETQAALRESEERFRLMADSAPVLIWLAEPGRGCTWVNQQWLTFTGRKLEEELGDGWTEGIHPEDYAQCKETYTTQCAQRVAFQIDYRLRRSDGGYRWVLDCAAPRFDGNGEFLGYLGSCIDITERKEAETELARAKAAAEAANRTKDDFLAVLSHELRTPLTPVMLMASEFISQEGIDEEARADWMIVHKNISLQARLIDDLLDLTRVARGKLVLRPQPLDVHTVLQDALATVRTELSAKGHALKLQLEASNREVQGDAARLQQVFWNVLQNAVKFTPSGGSINVQTCNPNGNGRVCVRIADSGMGLTTDELNRIFNTFSQGDHATGRATVYGGLGLGLAITRELVQLHEGEITAASDGRNKGAVFTIELPTLS